MEEKDILFFLNSIQQPMLAAHIQLDGIVTLVDAKHIIAQLDKRTWLSKMNSLFLPSLSFFSLLTWTCSDAKLNIE